MPDYLVESQINRVHVVGLGGTGSWFIEPFARLLSSTIASRRNPVELVLIDGDRKESKNEARQSLPGAVSQYKSDIHADRINKLGLKHVTATSIPKYLWSYDWVDHEFFKDIEDEAILLEELDFISLPCMVLCPDNNFIRRITLEFLRNNESRDSIYIWTMAGNETHTGNANIDASFFVNSEKRVITYDPFKLHPELAEAEPEREDISCQERAERGDEQTLLANYMAASALLHFWNSILIRKCIDQSELVFNTKDCKLLPLHASKFTVHIDLD